LTPPPPAISNERAALPTGASGLPLMAAVLAYADDFKLMMIVALVALPLVFLLKRAEARPGETAVLE
jgi:DHA2 family multidrug resistance protein